MDIPRPSIAELIAKYELEPTLRDVYVEGAFDKALLEEVCRRTSLTDIRIYEIDGVDVSAEILTSHGLTIGNRQEVLALARELAKIEQPCKYRCIVDRDFDHWLGLLETTPRLFFTEYCDVQAYFLSVDLCSRLILTIANCKHEDWSRCYESLVHFLGRIYAIRLANRRLQWDMKWIEIDRCIELVSGCIVLRESEYVERLLQKNKRKKEQSTFVEEVRTVSSRLIGDPRLFVRGHDLVEILSWLVKKLKGVKSFGTPEAIERLLVVIGGEIQSFTKLLT